MNIEEIIVDIKSKIIDLTYFAFHIEKASDDGGQTIDIYVVCDDLKSIQAELSGKYGKARLIFYAMDEEDIIHLHDKE
mgnify:CR=1 FL=1|jgi:hypothetical protein